MSQTSDIKTQQTILRKMAEWIFLALLLYMPFHVFIATWIGSSFGILTEAKIFKDVLLFVGFVVAIFAVDQTALKRFMKDKLVWAIAAYALLTVLLAVARPTEQDAEVLGIVYNLRFLVFFLFGALVVSWQNKVFVSKAIKWAAVVGVAVAILAVVQYMLLPNDFLSHFGYSKANGTPPAFFIDDKPDLERAMSTIKDPNSLGAYLIIIATLLLGLIMAAKDKAKKLYAASLVATILGVWFSFSRGALLGLIIASAVFILLDPRIRQRAHKHKTKIAVFSVVLLSIATVGFVAARNTYFVKNVVFHADEQTVLEDPNELRLRFYRESLEDIAANPYGSGPGTAGLASIRNQEQGTILNENYYLQIATEVGVSGLILFLAIIGVVALRLFELRSKINSRALLASLTGLLFMALLIHVWSNEAVAYTWWGLAGLVVYARYTGRTRANK